jgi:hypothetical protein
MRGFRTCLDDAAIPSICLILAKGETVTLAALKLYGLPHTAAL